MRAAGRPQVCRCLPFIHRVMKLDDMVSVADLRAVVNDQFKVYKGVSNEKVVDRLILKGREELETYLLVHKNRHHMVTEYLEPILKRNTAAPKQVTGNSAFLDGFLSSKY
jgi:NADH dehydrogenase (ubiquinone) 1 alpha subcomplex subunit 6